MVKNCYIHIPFCNNICSYCDFSKLLYNEELVDKYLTSLENEIKNNYKNEKLETIYIGGGTPSSLSIKQLKRLFEITKVFNLDNKYEYSIECNFNSINKEKLLLFKEYGINRLSFGIESINDKNLRLLNRDEDKEEIKEKIKLCKSLGFNNINVDLMYAICNETMEELQKDIEFVLSLDVEHISTYSLIIEKNTKLYIDKYKNIDEEIDYKMYEEIIKRLSNSMYIHYEISNFAKRGYYSKHNMCYWKNNEYYGFGLGASKYLNNKRINNTKNMTKYLKGVVESSYEDISMNDKMTYEMILGLRLLDGVNEFEFYKKYNKHIEDIFNINSLLNKGLLKQNNNNIYIPEDKMYISNEILVNFIKE